MYSSYEGSRLTTSFNTLLLLMNSERIYYNDRARKVPKTFPDFILATYYKCKIMTRRKSRHNFTDIVTW